MTLLPERTTLNPVTEDPTLAPLDLIGVDPSWGIYTLAHDYTPPDLRTIVAGSADTDGEPILQSQYNNRTITYRVRIVEPNDPAGTNLLPNPSFELNLTGWTRTAGSFTSASNEREAVPAPLSANGSDFACHMKGTKDNTGTARFLTLDWKSGLEAMPAKPATKYSASAYVYVVDGPATRGFDLEFFWYNAAGELISQSTGPQTKPANGEVARLTFNGVESPALTAFVKVRVTCSTETALDELDYWVDRVQVEQTNAATAYFAGDTPGCDWSGARHNSASTRPAPDGTRFSRIYRDLTDQLDRIKRTKSGTLRRNAPGFKTLTFDLRTAKITEAPQDISMEMKRAEIACSFEADPGGRTAEVQIGGTREETVLPYLGFVVEGIPGDLEAAIRLVVEEKQAQNQLAVWIGAERDTYNASANAEPFYQAESRTPLGSAATSELAGASGAGKNVILATLANAFQAIFSTQASGGGAHLEHTGQFRVLARIARGPANFAGKLTVKWQYSVGDFAATTINEEDQFVLEPFSSPWPLWSIADLGVVTIPAVPAGTTQRWEGRLLAKSTVPGDQLYVDWILLLPASAGAGRAQVLPTLVLPSSFSVQDSYDQAAGALTGKAPAIGAGTYTLAGDAVGFTVNAGHYIERTEKSDAAGLGAYGIAGTTEVTNVALQINVAGSSAEVFGKTGGFVRYTDTNNHVKVVLVRGTVGVNEVEYAVKLIKKKAGVETTLGEVAFQSVSRFGAAPNGTLLVWITASGEWRLGWNGKIEKSGTDADFAEAGTLKTGKVGVYDELTEATTSTRFLDTLEVWAPTANAALFASRQLELRNNLIRRQDSAGTTWGTPPYKGDYLMLPADGPEKGKARIVIKGSRDPANDAGIDDIAAKVFATARYLVAPPA